MIARALPFACLFIVAMLSQPAWAQTVYRSTMPDGRVIFGDQPQPGATKVESSVPDTSDTGITVLQPGAEDALEQMEARRQSSGSSNDQRREAEEELQRAEAALANGKEPLPGERIGTAGGASRLNDKYWARQNRLEQDVVRARERLNSL